MKLPHEDKFAPLGGDDAIPNSPPDDEWIPIVPVPEGTPAAIKEIDGFARFKGMSRTGLWQYVDVDGKLLAFTVRFDRPTNGNPAEKEFRQFTFCKNANGRRGWRCKSLPSPRPLYGLDKLAEHPDAPVLIVEGEKTVQGATCFPGCVVVTSSHGAKAFAEADWSPLSGREVVIWPDHDEPGAKYAAGVAKLLSPACRQIRVVDVPASFPKKWDLADDAPEGADLRALLDAAREWRPADEDGPLPLFPPPGDPLPYPAESLGPTLSRAASAIAVRAQVPVAMSAQSVLAVASLSASAHADVQLPFGQIRPLSLFLATVARSGDRKSTSDNEALWPVAKREKALRDDYNSDMKTWRIDYAAWAAEKRKIEGDRKVDFGERKRLLGVLGDEPEKPLAPFLTTGDMTAEGLAKNWKAARPSLGVFSAEGATFTAGHAMNEENRLKTAAVLCGLWDGKTATRVRGTDNEVTILPGRRLALHIMIQPDAATAFLCNAALRDQGLLSRVLVAAPASLAGTRKYQEPCPKAAAAINAYGARILSLLETEPALEPGTRNELAPRHLAISAGATEVWRQFYNHIEAQLGLGNDLDDIGDFAAKAAEHAARLAGVITIVEDLHAVEIGLAAMECAVALVDWYIGESDRLKTAGRTDPKLLRAEKLLKWLQGRPHQTASFREMLQFSSCRTKAVAEECLGILKSHGWVSEQSRRPRIIKAVVP